LCTLKINGKSFTGLLHSRADISIISSDQWPHTWPTKDADFSIQGAGSMTASRLQQSVQKLKCESPEDLQAILQPYIAPIPMNLWSQDLLQQWNAEIHFPTTYSEQSLQMMKRMGYVPGKGLGKNLQGQSDIITPNIKHDRQGLSFS
jgi:hypothetical protein